MADTVQHTVDNTVNKIGLPDKTEIPEEYRKHDKEEEPGVLTKLYRRLSLKKQ